MKKFLLLIPVMLFPYFVMFATFSMFNNFLEKNLFGECILYNVFAVAVLFVAALICSIITIIICSVKKVESEKLLRINLIVKLIHIPAYKAIFIFGILFSLTIFTIGFSLAFIVFDLLTIFLSGLIGLTGIIRSRKENKLPKGLAILLGILQFIYCVDVICAVIAYLAVKNSDKIIDHMVDPLQNVIAKQINQKNIGL